MDALLFLLQSLMNVFWSLLDVVLALAMLVLPWLPVLAWIGFWLFAVNWAKVFPVLWRGGFIGVLLLMFVAVLVWGAVSPPVDGKHIMLQLTVGNFVGKFIYVTWLTCIALLCGSAQLSGAFSSLIQFPEEEETDDHGHGDHHGHGGDGHDHHRLDGVDGPGDAHGHNGGHLHAAVH